MKTLSLFLNWFLPLVILVLVIALMQTCQSNRETHAIKESNERLFIERIAIKDKELTARNEKIQEIHINRSLDSIAFKRDQDKANRTISALKARERAGRHTHVVTLTDTVYMAYDSALQRCADYVALQDSSYMSEIRLLNDKILLEHEKFLITLADRDSLVKLPQPSRFGLGVSAGPGLMTTGGELRAGIGMNIGLVYRLPITWPRWLRRR